MFRHVSGREIGASGTPFHREPEAESGSSLRVFQDVSG